jgi:acyl-CoA reductase-like NAD-dependent aldehyde dehydrogenase
MTTPRTDNYIDGDWRGAHGGRTFPSYNPADGSVIAEVARSDAVDVDAAVTAAVEAFPAWRATPAPLRANHLYLIAQIAQEREDELVQTICEEHGKTLEDAHGDVQELIHVALYWAGEGRRQFGSVVPSEKVSKLGFSRREPLGVVAALPPWNFPFTKVALKVFPAIVLGNTVVFKPAHETPLIGSLVQQLIHDAGVPRGVVNMVQGLSQDIGDSLVEHPGLDLISYTGQTEVGRAIAKKAAARLVPVSLELTAKNALIVNFDANLDLALDWAVLSAFATNGQRETAASRILVHSEIADRFESELVGRVERLKVGHPLDEATRVGPLISEEQLSAVDDYVRRSVRSGGRVLCGGARVTSPSLAEGFFYPPTVLTDVDPDADVVREEVLGPVTMLFRVPDLDTAVSYANGTPYGLSMSVFTRDIETALTTVDRLESGVTWINAGTVGAEVGLPFGGTKDTSIGTTEWGQGALDTFSRWKTTYINYGSRLRMVFEDTRLR